MNIIGLSRGSEAEFHEKPKAPGRGDVSLLHMVQVTGGAPSLAAVTAVCAEPYGFWLDTALAPTAGPARSFVGATPSLVFRSYGRRIEIDRPRGGGERFEADPFEVLRTLLIERASQDGAAVGYLGYGLRHHIEKLPAGALDDLLLPDCCLGFYDSPQEFDPAPLSPPAVDTGVDHSPFGRLVSGFSRAEYESAVQRILDYIRAGDIYQANLSQRFQAQCSRDPFDVYGDLRRFSPAPYAAFLRYPDHSVLSSSPELFLRYRPDTRRIVTRPIKGSAPRGRDSASDRALGERLQESGKDRAENVMIVDLERNDLGRVAEIGSVRVTGLWELETFATVHHLTSTVEARLARGLDVIDLLRATFPGGSITGAPKIRAMEIIDELEPVARGVYTGAIGHIGYDGSLDLNIAIRTMVIRDGTAYFHVGGGIVADSVPALEFEETLHKGAALASVLAGGSR